MRSREWQYGRPGASPGFSSALGDSILKLPSQADAGQLVVVEWQYGRPGPNRYLSTPNNVLNSKLGSCTSYRHESPSRLHSTCLTLAGTPARLDTSCRCSHVFVQVWLRLLFMRNALA
jgi:hypothetical protein